MARKQQGKNTWRGYVRCELSAEEKTRVRDAADDVTLNNLVEVLEGLIAEGLKFSLSQPREDASVTASLYDGRDGSVSQGYSLTAFGGSAVTAIIALEYKHTHKLKGDWARNLKAAPEDDDVG